MNEHIMYPAAFIMHNNNNNNNNNNINNNNNNNFINVSQGVKQHGC